MSVITGGSFPLYEAELIALSVKDKLTPYCSRIEIAGSIRRRCRTVGDIEIVAIPKPWLLWDFIVTTNTLGKNIKGHQGGVYKQIMLPQHIKLDLFLASLENWGLILAMRTGSADYSRNVLATGWAIKGYHSEGGVLYRARKVNGDEVLDKNNPVYMREEKDVFDFIGIPFKDPKDRSY